MRSERYFVVVITILLYVNLAAHYLANIDGNRPPRRFRETVTAMVPPFRANALKMCRKVEDVAVYEQQGSLDTKKLVGKEKKEMLIPCP